MVFLLPGWRHQMIELKKLRLLAIYHI